MADIATGWFIAARSVRGGDDLVFPFSAAESPPAHRESDIVTRSRPGVVCLPRRRRRQNEEERPSSATPEIMR